MHEKTVTTDDPPVDVEERWYECNILGGVKYVVQRFEGDVEPPEKFLADETNSKIPVSGVTAPAHADPLS